MLSNAFVFVAMRALCAAEEALRQALERGASDEKIKHLTDQLRAALDKLVQALAGQVCEPQHSSNQLVSSRTLRARYGGISARTIPRWIEASVIPPPDRIINNRHFWWLATLERHECAAVTAKIARKRGAARHQAVAPDDAADLPPPSTE